MTPKPLDPEKFGYCQTCNEVAIHAKDVKAAVVFHHQLGTLIIRAYEQKHISLMELDFLRCENTKDSFRGVMGKQEGF